MVRRSRRNCHLQNVPSPRLAMQDRDDDILAAALRILEERCIRGGTGIGLSSPSTVKDWLRLRMSSLEHEVFTVLFLDAQNMLIACDDLFTGTLTQTSVYPREIVKRALAHNAAAVILSHNHPSGQLDASAADKLLTDALKQALALVDVRVLDHIIIARGQSMSFAEHGLL